LIQQAKKVEKQTKSEEKKTGYSNKSQWRVIGFQLERKRLLLEQTRAKKIGVLFKYSLEFAEKRESELIFVVRLLSHY
jgi:hypothetical protein